MCVCVYFSEFLKSWICPPLVNAVFPSFFVKDSAAISVTNLVAKLQEAPAKEFTCLHHLGWSFQDLARCLDFWLWGCLEHMDMFTDGALPIQAWQCDPEATQRFAHAFEVTLVL